MRKIKNLNTSIKTIRGDSMKIRSQDGSQEVEITFRDYLLLALSTKFEIEDVKESYWTTELGIAVANTDVNDIEISDDKFNFLDRVIRKNKAKNAQGQEDAIFNPFELGQILNFLEESEKTNEGD